MDISWLPEMISILEKALANDGKLTFKRPTGDEVTVTITNELVNIIKGNKSRLLQIGENTFKQFLVLRSEGDDFEALVVIYSKLDNVELVEKATANAIEMIEIAKEIQATRKFWLDLARQLGTRVALGMLSALIV